jgi:hypothetical protein
MLKSPGERLLEKELRAQDAALAMQEYEAEKLAVVAKTARLRALRLAREAQPPVPAPAPTKKNIPTKKPTKEPR